MMRRALDFGAPDTDAGGNVAAKISLQRDTGNKRRPHGRDKVHESWVLLDFTQSRDVDPAGSCDTTEVVAGHVDDHDVLCAVLCRDVERRASGSLDRPGLQDVVITDATTRQEEFGTRRAHLNALRRQADEGRVTRRMPVGQAHSPAL